MGASSVDNGFNLKQASECVDAGQGIEFNNVLGVDFKFLRTDEIDLHFFPRVLFRVHRR